MGDEHIFSAKMKAHLASCTTLSERISFLERYLTNYPSAPHSVLAITYELLAELYAQDGRIHGDLYKKAAEHWELASFSEYSHDSMGRSMKRTALKNALTSYKKIQRIPSSSSLYEGLPARLSSVRKELLLYPSLFKKTLVTGFIVFFLVSCFYISSPLTGFVIGGLDLDETTWIGAFCVLVSILGLFFTLRQVY